jgi:hypothetical protein
VQTINKQTITIDLKRSTMIPLLRFIQGDTNQLEIVINDNGQVADFSNIGRIVTNFKRKDRKVISRLLTNRSNNKVLYQFGTEENQVDGESEIELQFFSIDNKERISTHRFKVLLFASIGTDEIHENNVDLPLLQKLFGEVESVKQDADIAAQYASEAAEYAVGKAEYAQAQGDYVESKKPIIDKFTGDQTNLQAQLDVLVVEGDSSPAATQARVDGKGKTYATLKQRLDEKEAEFASGLAEKATKTELDTLNQNKVTKGSGTLNDFDETTRAILQGLQPGQINAVLGKGNVLNENYKKDSITLDKMKFIKRPANEDVFYNKEVISGYILNHLDGKLTVNASYFTTIYMEVEELSKYYVGYKTTNVAINIQRFCFYDQNEVFLSYGGNQSYFDTPTGCKYVKLSISISRLVDLDKLKVQKNGLTLIGAYEVNEDIKIPRYETLKDNSVGNGQYQKDSITVDKIGFIKRQTNEDVFYNKVVKSNIALNVSGEETVNASQCTTEFLVVEELTKYCLGKISDNAVINIQTYAFYTEDKVFISYSGNQNNFTTPAGCKFVRLSLAITWASQINNIKLQKGQLSTIEPFELNIDLKIPRYETLKDNSVGNGQYQKDSITVDKIGFIKRQTNEDVFYNKVVKSNIALNVSGEETVNASQCTTEFLVVEELTKYCLGKISDNAVINIQTYAFYTEDKVFISYSGNQNNFTTPAGCKFVRLSLAITWASQINNIKLQKGQLSTIEPFELNIDLKIQRYETKKSVDYIESTITTVKKKILDKHEQGAVNYIFITDLHYDDSASTSKASIQRQLYSVNEIANNTPVDFVVIGGDLYSGNYFGADKQLAKDLLLEELEILKNCKKPVFVIKGNHDDNSYFKIYSPATLATDVNILSHSEFDAYTNGVLSNSTSNKNNYFYYDLDHKKTRLIFLNSSDYPIEKNGDGSYKYLGYNYVGYSLEQLKWLINTALTKDDYKYIFYSHAGLEFFTVYNRDILINMLTCLATKTVFSNPSVGTKDFANAGDIQLFNFGHLHADIKVKHSTILTPYVGTGSAIVDNNLAQEVRDVGYEMATGRQYGNISECLFDIVMNKRNAVETIRFGAGNDALIQR